MSSARAEKRREERLQAKVKGPAFVALQGKEMVLASGTLLVDPQGEPIQLALDVGYALTIHLVREGGMRVVDPSNIRVNAFEQLAMNAKIQIVDKDTLVGTIRFRGLYKPILVQIDVPGKAMVPFSRLEYCFTLEPSPTMINRAKLLQGLREHLYDYAVEAGAAHDWQPTPEEGDAMDLKQTIALQTAEIEELKQKIDGLAARLDAGEIDESSPEYLARFMMSQEQVEAHLATPAAQSDEWEPYENWR